MTPAYGLLPDLVQGPLATAELEKITLQSGRFEQEWSLTKIHGKEAGRGLRAAVNQHGHSLIMSFSVDTDLKVYDAKGKQLASINTSGIDQLCPRSVLVSCWQHQIAVKQGPDI